MKVDALPGSVTPTSVLIQHNMACLLNPVVYVGF